MRLLKATLREGQRCHEISDMTLILRKRLHIMLKRMTKLSKGLTNYSFMKHFSFQHSLQYGRVHTNTLGEEYQA
jgi:hypothetical protein